uniref:Uncharacterized protein n=1 Tax=Cacopsylla melanoneura TaxID=428564 RepID=A0A8D8XWK2_9HEMI
MSHLITYLGCNYSYLLFLLLSILFLLEKQGNQSGVGNRRTAVRIRTAKLKSPDRGQNFIFVNFPVTGFYPSCYFFFLFLFLFFCFHYNLLFIFTWSESESHEQRERDRPQSQRNQK